MQGHRHQRLEAEDPQVGRLDVSTLMKRMAIAALYRRPNTSKPVPCHTVYPHMLRNVAMARPNQVWAMDITYAPMARGFVYLAAVVDWFSRKVLAWGRGAGKSLVSMQLVVRILPISPARSLRFRNDCNCGCEQRSRGVTVA